MRYLRNAETIPYPGIRGLVRRRIAELSLEDIFDPDTMGSLILVEPGDTAPQLEKECGCLITTGLFGQPARIPCP